MDTGQGAPASAPAGVHREMVLSALPVKTSPESTQTMAKVVKRLTPSVVAASTKEAKAKPKLSKAKKAPKNSAARARVAKKP